MTADFLDSGIARGLGIFKGLINLSKQQPHDIA